MQDRFILNGNYNTQKQTKIVTCQIDIPQSILPPGQGLGNRLYFEKTIPAENTSDSMQYLSITSTLAGGIGMNSPISAYEDAVFGAEFGMFFYRDSATSYKLVVVIYNYDAVQKTVQPFSVTAKLFLFAPPTN